MRDRQIYSLAFAREFFLSLDIFQYPRNFLEILLKRRPQSSIVERGRRMVEREDMPITDPDDIFSKGFPVYLGYFRIWEEGVHRMPAERHDHFRIDDANLFSDPVPAGEDFFRGGISILWWAILHSIRDIDICTRKVNRCEELIQEFPCRSDKRNPLLVFLLPRGFADEEDVGIRISTSQDSLYCRRAERAPTFFHPFRVEFF